MSCFRVLSPIVACLGLLLGGCCINVYVTPCGAPCAPPCKSCDALCGSGASSAGNTGANVPPPDDKKKVFEGNTAVDVCIAHVTKAPLPPSQVTARPIDPGLEAVLMKCLEKKPSDRYASALELRGALLALPAAADWSVAQARHWWTEFRPLQHEAGDSEGTTRTLPVDLEHHRETLNIGA